MMRLAAVLLLSLVTTALAESPAHPPAHAPEAPEYAHPALPAPQIHWPAPVLALVFVMFTTAAVVGAYARMEMEEEMPPAHSHDEAAGGHGHGH